MKKNFKLLFDMDNTVVNFDKGIDDKQISGVSESQKVQNLYDIMNEKGFFKNLEPLPFLNEVNKLAAICPENVYIISACISSKFCKKEKIEWLKEHLPQAQKENVIFLKAGENKADKARRFFKIKALNEYYVLIDDYGKNLEDWEAAGGTAIKFKTETNTSDPSKYKHIIKDFSELFSELEKIRKEMED